MAADNWKTTSGKEEKPTANQSQEKNFLALATEIIKSLKEKNPSSSGGSANKKRLSFQNLLFYAITDLFPINFTHLLKVFSQLLFCANGTSNF